MNPEARWIFRVPALCQRSSLRPRSAEEPVAAPESDRIDGVPHRLDIATGFAGQLAANNADPRAVLHSALGPLASAETRETIARAESRPQALALLVMAPEFLRR